MSFEIGAQYLQGATAAIAAARLMALGIGKRQPGLLFFLIDVSLGSFLLNAFSPESAAYFWVYLLAMPVAWIASIAAVREMISLSMAAYPGIRTACRWTMLGAVAVSIAVSLLVTAAFWRGGVAKHGLYYIFIIERSILFSLAVVIVSLLLFLSHYPLKLHHNKYVSCGFFSAIFLSQSVQQLFRTLAPKLHSARADTFQLAIETLCLVGWALLLRPEESFVERRRSPDDFTTPEEAALLQQLDSFDKLLSRAGRR